MEIEEDGFFRKIWTSIKDFEGYEEFAAGKLSKAIIYMLLLTIIFTTVVSACYTYKASLAVKDVKEYINKNFEDIRIVNRKVRNFAR